MALSELQKRQLENQAFAKMGGRSFLKGGVESAEEETERKLKQALAMSEEQRKKKWEEARVTREAAFARGPQQNRPDTRSLMSAEVAGDILPDSMPGDQTADMNVIPKAAQSQRVDPLAKLRKKQAYMSMINAMESGNIPEQTDDMGGAAAQANFDNTIDRIQQEDVMSKRPDIGINDIARKKMAMEQTPSLGRDSVQPETRFVSPSGGRFTSDTARQFQDKFRNETVEGVGDIFRKRMAAEDEAIKKYNREQTPSLAPGEETPQMSAPGGRGSEDSYNPGKWNKKFLEDNVKRQQSPQLFDMDQSNQGEVPLETAPDLEAVDNFQRKFDVSAEAANIARQQKFDAENKAERERLFAGLEKKEKALAKEASGKYYVDPITGYAINLDKLKKHAKRQEVMAIAKELPAATKVKYLRNEGILDDEDIPKDQKLTLEKEKLRVEIAKIKAQTNEIKNKNPQAEMLVDMAGEAFEIGAYDAGFKLLQDAYGEPLPQNISKIFQSIKSKSSKKGGADDIDYTGHWFDPVKTGMPGKDYANRFYNTVRDVRQELTAIRENPLDETSVGKAVNLFAAHGIDYQEFIQRVKPGSLEYQDAFRKVVEKEVDARLGRPGIYNGVFSGLADDMAQEKAVLDQKQVEHDTGMTPEAEGLSFLQNNPEFIGGMSEEDDEYSISPGPDRPGQETTETPGLFDDTVKLKEGSTPMLGPAKRKLAENILSGISNYQRMQANRKPDYKDEASSNAKQLNDQDLFAERNRLLALMKDGAPGQGPELEEFQKNQDRLTIINKELFSRRDKGKNSGLMAATVDTFKEQTSGSEKTKEHEDFNAKPYKDGGGWSIGHGFHLDKESITKADLQGSGISDVVKKALLAGDHTNKDLKLTKPQSEKIFQNIYNRRRRETVTTYPWVKDLPEQAKNVVYDMAFNLGRTKFKKFKGMLEALEQGDYKKAALHVKFVDGPKRGKLTPYWGQTKSRAEDNFDILMRL